MSRNLRTFQLANLLAILALFLSPAASAQVTTGTPPFASFSGGPDSVNLADLNSYTVFPVLQKSGRSSNVSVEIAYNTSIWAPVPPGSTEVWKNDAAWGWNLHAPIAGNVRYSETTSFGNGCATLVFSN